MEHWFVTSNVLSQHPPQSTAAAYKDNKGTQSKAEW